MIQSLKLSINNFLSFGENVEIDLSNRGLVCVTGQNLDSSASSSNGAGKSGLFEALYYCIHGKILRAGGVTLDKTIRRGCKGGNSVCYTYRTDKDRILKISRYHKDKKHGDSLYFEDITDDEAISLGGQDKKATQQAILDSVGISASLFKQIILFGEGGMTRFSELSDSEKKKLIEEILGLHIYERAGKLSREKMASAHERRMKLKREVESTQEHLVTAEKRLSDAESAREEWDRNRDSELKYLYTEKEKLEKIKVEVSAMDPSLWLESKKQKEEILSSLREKMQTIHQRERKVNQGYMQKKSELDKEQGKLEAKKIFLKKEHERISCLIYDGICPTCKQPTDKLDSGEIDRIDHELTEIRKEENVIYRSMSNLEQAKEKVISSLNTEEGTSYEEEKKLISDIDDLKSNISTFSSKSSSLDLLVKIEKRYKLLLEQVYPHEEKSIEAQKELIVLQNKLNELSKINNEEEILFKKYKILNEVFLLIRSFVFESFVKDLNKSLYQYCQIQNNGSLSASISATSETSKGENREKVSILVHNPTGGETYESCSVGEKRRLDLPIAFALQDFSAKRGLGIGISLLDEMFEAVDEVGKGGILNLLNTIAARPHTPSVFVVTHSESLKPMFSSFIDIIKENGVSTII